MENVRCIDVTDGKGGEVSENKITTTEEAIGSLCRESFNIGMSTAFASALNYLRQGKKIDEDYLLERINFAESQIEKLRNSENSNNRQ